MLRLPKEANQNIDRTIGVDQIVLWFHSLRDSLTRPANPNASSCEKTPLSCEVFTGAFLSPDQPDHEGSFHSLENGQGAFVFYFNLNDFHYFNFVTKISTFFIIC